METHSELVNLNAAEERELTQLPSIGADKARRIVHVRAIRKGFRDWEDFTQSSGFAQEDIEAIKVRAWIGPTKEEVDGTPAPRRAGRRPTGVRRPHR